MASSIRAMPMIAENGEASRGPPDPATSGSETVGTITPSTVPVNSVSGRTGRGQGQIRKHSPPAAVQSQTCDCHRSSFLQPFLAPMPPITPGLGPSPMAKGTCSLPPQLLPPPDGASG